MMTDHKGYESWIGKSQLREDVISPRLVQSLAAVLAPHYDRKAAVPHGIFWCLSPDMEPADRLGGDGHPALGLHMPDLPFERRMWAGGELWFKAGFQPGQTIRKTSIIKDIQPKTGRSGDMIFVSVDHHYETGQTRLLEERQTIVYRQAVTPSPAAGPARLPDWTDCKSWEIMPDPVMLFRYSALTFNGHRIHYDLPYATGIEGHGGLLVHGPLQAIWLINRAFASGYQLEHFAYRGLSALVCGTPVRAEIGYDEQARLAGRVVTPDGRVTMQALMTGKKAS